MKQKHTAETKRSLALNVVMACALLLLSVVMIKSSFSQFISHRIVSGCVSAVGGLLFFGVSMMLLTDLCKRLQHKERNQEDSSDGH